VTRQCIRTGLPNAGAAAEDCAGLTRSAEPAAPTPPAPVAAPAPAVTSAPAKDESAEVRQYEAEPTPLPDDGILSSRVNPNYQADQAAAQAALEAKPPAPSVARMTLNAEADFDFNQWTLRPAGQAKLDQFAEQLNALQYSTVRVVGHTDRIGSPQVNQKLSLRRAQAVKDYLASKQVDPARIVAVGVGSEEPVTTALDCQRLKGRALVDCLQPDRRVDIDAEAMKVAGK
jgi:outer membrane protein OmpA-like peptidoglycan-associated protein